MGALNSSVVLMAAMCVLLADSVDAWYGVVTFYQGTKFSGNTYPWGIRASQRCFNLSCWNNKASSVKWSDGIPTTNSAGGHVHIAFYTDKDCTGTSRDWITDIGSDYPQNFKLDGINDDVSSFMIWENSEEVSNGYVTPCPWGTS